MKNTKKVLLGLGIMLSAVFSASAQVTVYEGKNYTGKNYTFKAKEDIDLFKILPNSNTVGSIKVAKGWKATLIPDYSDDPYSQTFEKDVPDLSKEGVTKVVFLTIEGASIAENPVKTEKENPLLVKTKKTELKTGEVLNYGDAMISVNGNFMLRAHDGAGGGQICTYTVKNGKLQSYIPYISMGKTKQGKVRLELWADGNLVIMNENNEVTWASSTVPSVDPRFKDAKLKPVKMMVADDGSIALYNASGEKVWYHNLR